MYEHILTDLQFFLLLFEYDRDLASELHGSKCKICGGILDWANYHRQPRGGPKKLDDRYKIRFSLCCRQEGCRKRVTPPSVRFLGRRVYFSAVFSLIVALTQGPNGQKAAKIKEIFGISHQTFLRWKKWWQQVFPATKFWQGEKDKFLLNEEKLEMPFTLLNQFQQIQECCKGALHKFLIFISPVKSK